MCNTFSLKSDICDHRKHPYLRTIAIRASSAVLWSVDHHLFFICRYVFDRLRWTLLSSSKLLLPTTLFEIEQGVNIEIYTQTAKNAFSSASKCLKRAFDTPLSDSLRSVCQTYVLIIWRLNKMHFCGLYFVLTI